MLNLFTYVKYVETMINTVMAAFTNYAAIKPFTDLLPPSAYNAKEESSLRQKQIKKPIKEFETYWIYLINQV